MEGLPLTHSWVAPAVAAAVASAQSPLVPLLEALHVIGNAHHGVPGCQTRMRALRSACDGSNDYTHLSCIFMHP